MAFYEHVLIARQDLSSQQVDSLTDEFSNIVMGNGGKVVKVENWGLRTLAYRVKKNRKGHYVMLCLDAPSEAINELERNERIHEDVLRWLTIRVEGIDDGPSAMKRSKDREERDRDDRGDRGDRGDREDRNDRGDRGDRNSSDKGDDA